MPDLVEYVTKYAKDWQAFPDTGDLEAALLSEFRRLFVSHGWQRHFDGKTEVEEEFKASDK